MASTIPLPIVSVPSEHKDLFASINTFVHAYMSSSGHDNSHDYHHILRVLSNANLIFEAEQKANPDAVYDTCALFLAALLHDVGDYKYAKPGEDVENQVSILLLERGASTELALKVQTIVKHVGYTNESKNPQSVIDVLARYPELAIVQDADRLDAIGAVGVARCFTFGGARKQGEPMAVAIEHFEEKLVKLPEMMKTQTGRMMAEERKSVLVEFAKQFEAEAKLSFSFAD
ncbi:hypothetical protein K458DRAFT_414419 [Lentithecium fluviatile CBS 122367]|uniref:HD/PDEase domain-containing protein n=1 Tax=Lentithecium fluviatile CBS 122367 TaxID=1168545 RepID=A0A6G1JDS4_9PLEO|nr:hypothetical protein K458DRAFT_414419 [Lentithecium fluviatile CBS 122367]